MFYLKQSVVRVSQQLSVLLTYLYVINFCCRCVYVSLLMAVVGVSVSV